MAVIPKYDSLLGEIREYDTPQPLGTFSTAFPSNPSIGKYEFIGTNATIPTGGSGETYYSGDSAFWNGSSWVRIPFQSLTNYYTKDESFKISPFYDGVFGKTDTAAILLVHKAIKSIRLIGDWDKTNRYVVRYLSNNSGTTPYSIVIDQVNVAGTSVAPIPYNTNIEFTPAFAPTINSGKPTTVLFNKIGNKQVLAVIDYSILAANTAYSFGGSAVNFVIKPDSIIPFNTYEQYIQSINGVVYDAGFGLTKTAYQDGVNNAVKSIQLIGNWDRSKRYQIGEIGRANVATSTNYQLKIIEVDASGTSVADTYISGAIAVTEAGVDKTTRVAFPVVNGLSVVMVIDYNLLTTNNRNYIQGGNNFLIKPELITHYGSVEEANMASLILTAVPLVENPFTYLDYQSETPTPKNNARELPNIPIQLASANKQGALVLRIDDNEPDAIFDNSLEKFNFRCTYSANSQLANISTMIDRQRRGHEICDHTPLHDTSYFNIPTGKTDLFTSYVGNGIREIRDGKAFLDYKVFNNGVDVTYPTTPATELSGLELASGAATFALTSGSNRIVGNFTALMTYKFYYLYIDSSNGSGGKIGWVVINTNTLTNTDAYIYTQDGVAINATVTENIKMYAQQAADYTKIALTESATYLLMLAGQISLEQAGLSRPKIWSAPGGLWATINPTFANSAIKRLGMIMSYTLINSTDVILTYNMNRTNPRTTQWSTGLDFGAMSYSDLPAVKNLLSEYFATHKVVQSLSHHYIAHRDFGTADGYTTTADRIYQYNKFIHDLCQWLYDIGARVITGSEQYYLLNETKTNPSINIIPNLYTDRAVQSKPDGHVLGTGTTWVLDDGVPEDKLHCLKRTTASSANPMTTITNLGGLEKGKNNIGCWIKGTVGDTITIDWGGIKTSTFVVATTGYNEFTDTLVIPYTTNFITIVIKATVVTSDCRISGIYLNK